MKKRLDNSGQLAFLRRRIDVADDKIIRLLAERISLVEKVLPLKKSINSPAREKEILGKAARLAVKFKTDPEFINSVYLGILKESRKFQKRRRAGK